MISNKKIRLQLLELQKLDQKTKKIKIKKPRKHREKTEKILISYYNIIIFYIYPKLIK